MSADTPPTLGDNSRLRGRRATSTSSITESEDTVRNLKASESVQSAFMAAGIPSPPGDVAAIIANHVKGTIQGLSLSQVANMSPGSGELGSAAVQAVNQFVNSLTPAQRDAVKAGVNPLDSAAMMKLAAGFRSDPANFERLAVRDGADSSTKYSGLGNQALTPTQLQARDIAIKSGLGWAADNRELLSLGPSAMQALADVHLHKDSYERFRNGGLTAKTVVEGARYAKKLGIDLNQASRDYEATHNQLNEADKREHNHAVDGLYRSHNAPQAEQERAKKEFNEKMDGLKKRNPNAAPQIEQEKKTLKTAQQQEQAATTTANNKDAKANTATTQAQQAQAQKNTTKSKLLSSLD